MRRIPHPIRWTFGHADEQIHITGSAPGLSLTLSLSDSAESERIVMEIRTLEAILTDTWIANERRKEKTDA